MKIIIAPFAAKLRSGKQNAKNPPVRWWETVVRKLNEHGHEIIQVGGIGETRILGVSLFITNWPLDKLRTLVNDCDTWISVDSFLPHLCWESRLKSGVVVFSVSDPKIFGHDENVNLLKGREYLRPLQFQDWESWAWNEDAFVTPDEVVNAVITLTSSTKSTNRTRPVSRVVSMENETSQTADVV